MITAPNESSVETESPPRPQRNDNSNPQQGTGGTRPNSDNNSSKSSSKEEECLLPGHELKSAQIPWGYLRPSLKIPPNRKDERKLFVGGLPSNVTDEEFRTFFEQFGPVMDSIVLVDRLTNRSRGFGFVTFEDVESSRKVLSIGNTNTSHPAVARLDMRGKTIEVKSAEPKESTPRRPFRPSHFQHSMPGGQAVYPVPTFADPAVAGGQYPPPNDYPYAVPPHPYYPPGAFFAGYRAPMYYSPTPDAADQLYPAEVPPPAYAFFATPSPPFGLVPQVPHQQQQPFQPMHSTPHGMNAQDGLEMEHYE